ncbi:MAG: M16 family metallopeptidase [Syntrophothermus sp.]
MHFKYIQEAGGNLNGSTSLDRTNYFQSVPSNYLELVLWLESDRMGFLIPALNQDKLDNQIDVVMNERRQRYDNAPYGLAWEKIFSNLYPENHPYHWPTIGWMEDIANIKLDEVKNFFHKYYVPNNASLVIGGSFKMDRAAELVEKYFGSLERGTDIIQPARAEKLLEKNIELIHEDKVSLSRIYLAWNSSDIYTPEDACMDILAYIIAGSKNSRIYKTLIYEKEIAQDVSAFQHSVRLGGSFLIVATAKPGTPLDTVKEIIFDEINKAVTSGITDEELSKAKNNIKASFIYSMQNINSLSNRINEYNYYLNEPDSFKFDLDRYQNVTAEDIKKTASAILSRPYVELRIVPANQGEVS